MTSAQGADTPLHLVIKNVQTGLPVLAYDGADIGVNNFRLFQEIDIDGVMYEVIDIRSVDKVIDVSVPCDRYWDKPSSPKRRGPDDFDDDSGKVFA